MQAAVNPYVANVGPIKSIAQRAGFPGIANKVAGIFGITVLDLYFCLMQMTSFKATAIQELRRSPGSWIRMY